MRQAIVNRYYLPPINDKRLKPGNWIIKRNMNKRRQCLTLVLSIGGHMPRKTLTTLCSQQIKTAQLTQAR